MRFGEYLTENNTFRGDVNEILFAMYLVGGSWERVSNAQECRQVLKNRKAELKDDEIKAEQDRAAAMAAETLNWLKEAKLGSPRTVHWIGRAETKLSDVIDGADGTTPADIVLELTSGHRLGISAKSTHQSREIVYRSIGLGQVDLNLKTDLVGIRTRAEKKFIADNKLSEKPVERKQEIRRNPILLGKANEQRNVVLRNIRNKMFSKMSTMTQLKLKKFISGFLMGKSIHAAPKILPYIQVTGHGSGKVTITDPKKDTKLFALQTKKVTLAKSGNDSFTVRAGDINILRARVKYGTVPLASPIELSIDPWSVKDKDNE